MMPACFQLCFFSQVELFGLQARPELNGRKGVAQSFLASAGRYAVLLDDGAGPFRIKPANLSVVPHPTATAGALAAAAAAVAAADAFLGHGGGVSEEENGDASPLSPNTLERALEETASYEDGKDGGEDGEASERFAQVPNVIHFEEYTNVVRFADASPREDSESDSEEKKAAQTQAAFAAAAEAGYDYDDDEGRVAEAAPAGRTSATMALFGRKKKPPAPNESASPQKVPPRKPLAVTPIKLPPPFAAAAAASASSGGAEGSSAYVSFGKVDLPPPFSGLRQDSLGDFPSLLAAPSELLAWDDDDASSTTPPASPDPPSAQDAAQDAVQVAAVAVAAAEAAVEAAASAQRAAEARAAAAEEGAKAAATEAGQRVMVAAAAVGAKAVNAAHAQFG
jgi:hypothetical protein